MFLSHWNDLTPSRRCEWLDQLRAWAVIVMIEVHCVNTWLAQGLRPEWLNFLNGLVAPSFLMCAGFSLVLSTFRTDGTIRPFWPETAKRLGFILACAYALHAPGLTFAEWTILATPQKLHELFKLDVLQCIVASLLILHLLARTLRHPRAFTLAALAVAVWIPLVSPFLWAKGVGDGLWLPLRGLLNGNPDRGVQALFPLFPWLAFPAFGAFLGGCYRWARSEANATGRARMSELHFLLALLLVGLGLWLWGSLEKKPWLWMGQWMQDGGVWRLHNSWGAWTWDELEAIHNTTLPSVADRMGWICMGGAALGLVELFRPRWTGPNPIEAASRESLLVYMLHLNLIFGILLAAPVAARTGWDWHALGWGGTLGLTATIIALNLAVAVLWQRVRRTKETMHRLQTMGLAALALWFVLGGWGTFRYYLQSPELAKEPYPFLNAARIRKGLPPTPDGLCRDPEEYFREAASRGLALDEDSKRALRERIGKRP